MEGSFNSSSVSMAAPHNMVDSWLERDLNGVGMLARIPIPVREAGKEVLVRANRRGGGWFLECEAEEEGSVKDKG
jgi:hypothetical protein